MIEPPPSVPPLEKRIERKTSRQIWLQIYLPLVLGVLFLAGLAFWVVNRTFGTISVWSDVALVLLVIPAFLLGLIALVVFIGVTYAAFWVWGRLPSLFGEVRGGIERVEGGVRKGADLSLKPVVGVRKAGAAVRSVSSSLRSFFRSL